MNEVKLITSNLIDELKQISEKADTIYWVVAFAMKSGVRMVLPLLKEALARGADVKILVGDYLYISHPDALQLLFNECSEAEFRLYESNGISFHPKAYLFRTPDQTHTIVGSSNLSQSALYNGIEWNLHAPTSLDASLFVSATSEFLKLFLSADTLPINSEVIAMYRQRYDRANLSNPTSYLWDSSTEVEMMFGSNKQPDSVADSSLSYEAKKLSLTPRPAQVLALEALRQTREEQYNKALAILATGLGKTYLAAFFANDFKKVLFIAHREEILHQASDSFQRVHPNKTTGMFNGQRKEKDTDFVFASVFTLAADFHLTTFQPDEFDLIVIDEFHHATAPTYERILNYFKPEFLLGITATPDRLDNKDVYALCDGNVAITIHFVEAIRRGWLAPFVYHGVFDKTDYSGLKWLGTRYDEEQLLLLQSHTHYANALLLSWELHKQTRTIAFCSSVKQALFLSEHFSNAGYKSIALHGKSQRNERLTARQRLEAGELDIIFTVDLFNEGIDIPTIDTLLFARPTESLSIFTQQIGRGLRISADKSHCVIIDFIGNYRNAEKKLSVFTTDFDVPATLSSSAFNLPESCEIHLDSAVIDLLAMMKRKQSPRKHAIIEAFKNLKLELGRRPSYLEFHLKAPVDSRIIKQEFGSYIGMLVGAGDLSESEIKLFSAYENWLLEVNGTSMTKSYKMILVAAMLARGIDNWLNPITPQQAAPFFHQYLTEKDYRFNADLSDSQGQELRIYNETKVATLIARMPMTYWSKSSKGLLSFEDNVFYLQIEASREESKILHEWTKEVCEYRLHAYFERKSSRLNN